MIINAADAKAGKNKRGTVKAREPGSWINPADNKKVVAASVSTSPVFHVVVKSDTVSALALRYGSTQVDIKKWNKLKDDYLIKIGQKLRVKQFLMAVIYSLDSLILQLSPSNREGLNCSIFSMPIFNFILNSH